MVRQDCNPVVGAHMLTRMKHAGKLAWEITAYAIVNRAWWLLPLAVVLFLASGLVFAGQVAAPFTLYTLF